MTASELETWLKSDESQAVGQKDGGGESVGHDSGRRIVKLLKAGKADLSAEDIGHMSKTNGYVSRHVEQRPKGDVEDSKWRSSLMNWGHDPLK